MGKLAQDAPAPEDWRRSFEPVRILGGGRWTRRILCRDRAGDADVVVEEPRLAALTSKGRERARALIEFRSARFQQLENTGEAGVLPRLAAANLGSAQPWLAVEAVPGRSLREMYPPDRRSGRIPERSAWTIAEILRAVLSLRPGLASIHALGIAHGFLHPETLSCAAGTDGDGPKLRPRDLGWAELGDGEARVPGTDLFPYLPRQALESVGPASPFVDLWSLAAIVFELLSGAPPQPGKERRFWHEEIFESRARLASGVAPGLPEFIPSALREVLAAIFRQGRTGVDELFRDDDFFGVLADCLDDAPNDPDMYGAPCPNPDLEQARLQRKAALDEAENIVGRASELLRRPAPARFHDMRQALASARSDLERRISEHVGTTVLKHASRALTDRADALRAAFDSWNATAREERSRVQGASREFAAAAASVELRCADVTAAASALDALDPERDPDEWEARVAEFDRLIAPARDEAARLRGELEEERDRLLPRLRWLREEFSALPDADVLDRECHAGLVTLGDDVDVVPPSRMAPVRDLVERLGLRFDEEQHRLSGALADARAACRRLSGERALPPSLASKLRQMADVEPRPGLRDAERIIAELRADVLRLAPLAARALELQEATERRLPDPWLESILEPADADDELEHAARAAHQARRRLLAASAAVSESARLEAFEQGLADLEGVLAAADDAAQSSMRAHVAAQEDALATRGQLGTHLAALRDLVPAGPLRQMSAAIERDLTFDGDSSPPSVRAFVRRVRGVQSRSLPELERSLDELKRDARAEVEKYRARWPRPERLTWLRPARNVCEAVVATGRRLRGATVADLDDLVQLRSLNDAARGAMRAWNRLLAGVLAAAAVLVALSAAAAAAWCTLPRTVRVDVEGIVEEVAAFERGPTGARIPAGPSGVDFRLRPGSYVLKYRLSDGMVTSLPVEVSPILSVPFTTRPVPIAGDSQLKRMNQFLLETLLSPDETR